MPTELPIDDIRTDGGTQPRAEINRGIVSEYAEDLERGDSFPPVKVVYDGEDYWLYDGFHRVEAYREQRRASIPANVEQGTKQDAQWASLAANQKHGLRRCQADKRRAIKRALKGWGQKYSDNRIAQHLGVSNSTVSKYRRSLCDSQSQTERTGADGRTIDTSNIGSSSGSSSSQKSTSNPEPRGDGAPRGQETADPDDAVTAGEAVERVCQRLKGIRTSSVFGELKELRRLRDELSALSGKHEEAICTELRSTAERLLDWADEFSISDNQTAASHE